ncbi:MAG: chromosomal replication initiation protein DnaA [Deltaproteobacteria bacterium RBG_16_48_10]|nr:MAG: chromosomal replication initiation protein DnaA [Deltaproteobacteria bacterium RBG_16_48_10]
MENIWSKVIDSLKERVGQQNFDIWIKPIQFVSVQEEGVKLEVPNHFFKEWIHEHYASHIKEVFSQIMEKPCQIHFLIKNKKTNEKELIAIPFQRKQPEVAPSLGTIFNTKYTFDNFVVGASNQFAHAACLAVANMPAKNYNPLFIYGGVGLGKTHLLHAIGNHIIQQRIFPDVKKICYLSAEEFTNELINSLRFDKMDEFRNRFRRMDILLIDDIQFIAGKERTEEEFFHTFNSLHDARKQIVVTSDKFPKDIPKFEERLRSRFEWGLIADIQPPDIETKVAILRKKAESENISLSNEVAFFLASQIDSNIRVLEGCLIRISAFSSLTKTPVNIDVAKEVLKNIIKPKEELTSIDTIQKVVANSFNIKISDLKMKRKYKSFVLPRQIAMYLSRKLTDASLLEIGDKFGGKDHSTVLHSIKKVEGKMAQEASFKEIVENLKGRIKS